MVDVVHVYGAGLIGYQAGYGMAVEAVDNMTELLSAIEEDNWAWIETFDILGDESTFAESTPAMDTPETSGENDSGEDDSGLDIFEGDTSTEDVSEEDISEEEFSGEDVPLLVSPEDDSSDYDTFEESSSGQDTPSEGSWSLASDF